MISSICKQKFFSREGQNKGIKIIRNDTKNPRIMRIIQVLTRVINCQILSAIRQEPVVTRTETRRPEEVTGPARVFLCLFVGLFFVCHSSCLSVCFCLSGCSVVCVFVYLCIYFPVWLDILAFISSFLCLVRLHVCLFVLCLSGCSVVCVFVYLCIYFSVWLKVSSFLCLVRLRVCRLMKVC